jgi:hypothetical protein
MFLPLVIGDTFADNGGRMETQIIICFECRKRINLDEIKAGYHSHADLLEVENPFDPAVNADD